MPVDNWILDEIGRDSATCEHLPLRSYPRGRVAQLGRSGPVRPSNQGRSSRAGSTPDRLYLDAVNERRNCRSRALDSRGMARNSTPHRPGFAHRTRARSTCTGASCAGIQSCTARRSPLRRGRALCREQPQTDRLETRPAPSRRALVIRAGKQTAKRTLVR